MRWSLRCEQNYTFTTAVCAQKHRGHVTLLIYYYCCPLKIKRYYKQKVQPLAYLPKVLRNDQNCVATLQPLTLLAAWKQNRLITK